MNINDALNWGRAALTNSPTPRLDARLLLQHLLEMNHTQLVLAGERPLPPPTLAAYQSLLQRAAAAEPIPYITGCAPFHDFTLTVTSAVLIPRPETEELVNHVITTAREFTAPRIIDIGTGSGCIPIALARQLPHAAIFAGDVSPAALAVARANAQELAPGRIQFFCGDLLAPFHGPADIITANLPYITDEEWTRLSDGVKYYEPSLALRGGVDGLMLVRRLLQQARTRCRPHGRLFLEIGWRQGAAVAALAQQTFPAATVTLLQDLAGQDRIVEIAL